MFQRVPALRLDVSEEVESGITNPEWLVGGFGRRKPFLRNWRHLEVCPAAVLPASGELYQIILGPPWAVSGQVTIIEFLETADNLKFKLGFMYTF